MTHALAVPTMVEMLLRQDALPLRTLRVMQYGASPIHPDTLRTAMGQLPGAGFLTLYGQTEGSPITWLSPEDHRLAAAGREELLASVGRAAPGSRCASRTRTVPGRRGDSPRGARVRGRP